MDAVNDRRALDAPRIPLDVLVRLTHEDYEEPFDADGVDVSAGGLALRADYLPEVGDRLRCRFDCPPAGDAIELEGEVVWAHDAGERSGEFGLRFTELDVEAERALSRLVGSPGTSSADGPRVRLHLEAVATPIDAEVLERDDRWLTVEQELPFLRIGMAVAVEGSGPADGRLASVDLRLEDGVPRLVLVVEDARRSEERPEPDATLQDFDPPALARDAVDDVMDEIDDDPAIDADEPDALEPHEALADAPSALAARVAPIVARAKVLAESARPFVAALWAKLALLFARALEKGGPRAKSAWAKAKAITSALVAKAASRIARGRVKRRTTAAPPRVAQAAPKLRRQRAEPEAPAKKKSRRVIVLSALAFAGVGATVYAFTGEDPPAPAPAPIVVVPPAPAPVAEPAVDPEQGATAPAEAAPEAAQPEAPSAPQAGRLDAPTFPTLQAAAHRDAPAPREGTSFGAAEVSNGYSRTIRMSQPVTTLRGEAQPDGFTVTIPGALALGPAAPIAAANPSVEQAMILNRGDHAVLTVRFVAGRTPAYRVRAQGAAIEVTIER